MDQSVLSKLENGLLFLNTTLLEKIAQYYQVSLDELKTILYADKIMS
jgi:transcriptional regulator with XRE-family HTH domain